MRVGIGVSIRYCSRLSQASRRSPSDPLKARSFGMIRRSIDDPISLGSWYINGTDEFLLRVDSSAPLMHHDLNDLGSLILIRIIITKELTLPCSQVTFVGPWPLAEAHCVCFKCPL